MDNANTANSVRTWLARAVAASIGAGMAAPVAGAQPAVHGDQEVRALLGPAGLRHGDVQPVTAAVADHELRLAWRIPAGATELLLVDDAMGELVWRGTAATTELDMTPPRYRSLVLAAVGADRTLSMIAKIVATAPEPETGLSPLTAVTGPTGTDLAWAAPGSATTEGPGDDRTAVHRIVLGEQVTELPRARASLDTRLGERALVGLSSDATSLVPLADGVVMLAAAHAPTAGGDIDLEIVPPALSVQAIAELSGLRGLRLPAAVAAIPPSGGREGWHKNSTWTTYETYIPPAEVKVPLSWGRALACLGRSDQWFAGDGRGAAFNSGKYRTRVAIKYDWDAQRVTGFKDVHTTHRLRPQPAARTASASGIKIGTVLINSKFARVYIRHSVGNPFCPVTTIDYTSWQELYRNGKRWFYGSHVKMPAHEVYQEDWYTNGTRWAHYGAARVFTHAPVNPACLAGFSVTLCGLRHYQYVK